MILNSGRSITSMLITQRGNYDEEKEETSLHTRSTPMVTCAIILAQAEFKGNLQAGQPWNTANTGASGVTIYYLGRRDVDLTSTRCRPEPTLRKLINPVRRY